MRTPEDISIGEIFAFIRFERDYHGVSDSKVIYWKDRALKAEQNLRIRIWFVLLAAAALIWWVMS